MGLPAYPPDWATTMKEVQKGLKAAMTSAQTRVRYAAIRASRLIIGPQQGARIEIDPSGGPNGAPSITFRPQQGSKVATMIATSDTWPDEVTVVLRGGTNNQDSVYTQVTMGGGIARLSVHDAGDGSILRVVDVTEDYASIGAPSDSDRPYVYTTDDSVELNANGGRIVIASDGGIGLYTAGTGGAFLEMSPSGTVNKNW